MQNTLGQAVSCYRTSIPGGWGVSRITNGSQGFYIGEAISVFADGWPAQSGFHNYVGDKLGHSMTVTLNIPQFSLTVDPEIISQTVGVGDFRLVEVTVTNDSWYPAYFSSAVADGWNWGGCVWPTTNTQNVLKPRASMALLFSVNGTTCAETGGFNSAVVFAETHPVLRGSPVSITLPIQVAVIAELTPTPTPTMVKPTDTPLPPPVEPTTTPIQPTDTPLPPPVKPTDTPLPPPVEPTPTPMVTTPTVTPDVWQVGLQAPGMVVGGEQASFSIEVTNTGGQNQLGSVELFISLSPFKLIPSFGTSTGALICVSVSDKLIKCDWDFELSPGSTAAFTSLGTVVEVTDSLFFEGAWSFTGPGINDGAAVGLLVKPSQTPTPTQVSPTPPAPTASPTPQPTTQSWLLTVDSPGEVDGGDQVTFTMRVTNTGAMTQVGVITLTTSMSPFATKPQINVSLGTTVTTVATAGAQTNIWTFLMPTGSSATLNSTAQAVETDVNVVYLSTWNWEGPSIEYDGFAALTIMGEEDLPWWKTYLPFVTR